MSFTSTPVYLLEKPAVGTELDAWGDNLNDNWDKVEAGMVANAAAAATANSGLASHTHAFPSITGLIATAQYGDATITNAKLAAMPAANTVKGTVSGGAVVDLTAAQVAAIAIAGGIVSGGGGGSLTDGDKGDIIVAGTGTSWTIDAGVVSATKIADGAISNAKMAPTMAANTVKGTISGGAVIDLTAAQVAAIAVAGGISGGGGVPGPDTVTNAMLADMPALTMKGNNTGGAANPLNLTVNDVMSLLGAAPLASPTFTGTPAVSGAAIGALDNSTRIATTAHVYESVTEEQPNALGSGALTLIASDAGKMVTINGTATVNVNSNVFAANQRVDLLQVGAGVVTIGGTATRHAFGGANKLAGLYAGATLWFFSPTEYYLIGNIIV